MAPTITPEFTDTENQPSGQCSAVGAEVGSPEGPGRDGYKPLMRNREGLCGAPSPTGYTAEHTFPAADVADSVGRGSDARSHLTPDALSHNPVNPVNPVKDQSSVARAASTSFPSVEFFSASDIARALGTHKKRVHRVAVRERWPVRQVANRLEYQPPHTIAEIIVASPEFAGHSPIAAPRIRFADILDETQRSIILLREESVSLLARTTPAAGKEMALQLVCNHQKTEHPLFRISVSSLRRWEEAYVRFGIDGLVEQKRGASGRKPYTLALDESDILKTAAAAVEHGIRGRLNIARAYRALVADPELPADARVMHAEHASKSYVVPSVRDAIRRAVSPLAVTRLQVGPKAAKLDGPYTESTYDNIPAGHAITADDMTANVYVWVEWPNDQGWILIRPQVLAAMDVGTMSWVSVRVVMRSKGQYTKDDVWGLMGDCFDSFGLWHTAILEGGTWQSGTVIGQKTGISDEDRIGGLRSLGVKVIHTRSPRGKVIECAFNSLQHAMDNVRGYCGRDERHDCPEITKAHLAECRAGKAHPRQYFMHITEFSNHLAGVQNALNNERSDGKILRGRTPAEKWAEDVSPCQSVSVGVRPAFRPIPDSSKWLYRSAYTVTQVTRNGVTIRVGSGKFQQTYTYSNPEALETYRGQRVVTFWNDYDPDTDAIVYTIRSGRPHQFICVASRVRPISRLGASADEMHAEAARKKLAHNLAVAQGRSLAPYLQRTSGQVACAASTDMARAASTGRSGEDIASRIAAARAAAETREQSAARTRSAINRIQLTESDLAAATVLPAREPSEPTFTPEQIAELFSADPPPSH